jgi:tetratricopeptide (TPR) repeat protein
MGKVLLFFMVIVLSIGLFFVGFLAEQFFSSSLHQNPMSFFNSFRQFPAASFASLRNPTATNSPTPAPTLSPAPTQIPVPPVKILENDYHVFQTFNNCGPAALSMALSYYNINKTQEALGQDLRPYQNPLGNNDDKSVTLDELAGKAKEYALIPFHRPNGTITLIKQFIFQNIPVITRTLLEEHNDIGHYRVIKGYDDTTGEFVQDDSLQGHNLRYPYAVFAGLWKNFQYEYLILVPADKEQVIKNILGDDADLTKSWEKAVRNSKKELETNPGDIYARFNMSIALYHTGEYQQAASEFEKVENILPFRTLWYQIEPIQTYFALGNYQKVMTMTDTIFNNQNRAFSELYLIRGEIFKKQGNIEAAKSEFEKAVFYNKNLTSAREALQSLSAPDTL